MNIKVRALIKTLKMLAISIIVPFVVLMIIQLDPEFILYLFVGGFFAFMLWMVYSMNLHSLEHEEKLREMQENMKDRISGIVK